MKITIYTRIVFLLLFSSCINAISQNQVADSLYNILKSYGKNDSIRVNLLNEIAYQVYSIDIDRTLLLAKEANQLSDSLNYKRGKARSLRLIGIYHKLKANYPVSLEYYQKALLVSEEVGDKKSIADCYNSIGINYNDLGNKEKALENFQKALNMYNELGHRTNVSSCLNNIGVIYYNNKQYKPALKYYQQALEIDEKLGNKGSVSIWLNNIGEVYLELGDYKMTNDYLRRSLKLSMEIGDRYGVCYLYKDFGSLYLRTKEYSKALDYSIKSMHIAREIEYYDVLKDIYLQLSIIYKKTGNYKSAHENYVLYNELSDSIYNKENTKKIIGLEYQYKYQKEKQAIELEQQKKDLLQAEMLKRQKVVRNAFVAGFVFVVVLLFLIIRSYLQKSKTNKLLSSKNKSIEAKNFQLHEQNEEIQQLYEELTSTNEVLYVQNEELEKHRNNLEGLVKKRTRELEKAKDKAEESDRLKSAFLTNMSHEIRTPMNAIIGFADMLSDPELPDETKEELSVHINHSADTLLKLMDDIFDIAKIESGLLVISKQPFYLNDALEKLDPIYHEIMVKQRKSSVEFKIVKPENDIEINTDPLRLQQILFNLIDNAIKFTEDGFVEVGYHVNIEDSQKEFQFYVKDTGIGMSADQMEKIFKRFTKIEEDKTKIYRGAGLGLTISKNIVELLGGKIWAESEVGKGSVFRFAILG